QRRVLAADKDPIAEKRARASADAAQRAREQAMALTVGAVLEEFYRRHIAKKFKRPAETHWALMKYVNEPLGARRIRELGREDLARALGAVVDRGALIAANRALALLKQLFEYAEQHGYIENNPAAGLRRKHFGGTEKAKERALSFDDLGTLLRALDSERMHASWQTRGVLKLIVMTLQRPGEVAGMRWSEVDGDIWRLPSARTKNSRPHLVHLNAPALKVLAQLRPLSGHQDYVFASDLCARPITVRAISESLLRHLERGAFVLAGGERVQPFTPHDLRRSARSRLSDLGVAPHVAEKILNHALAGVLAVYD